VAASQPAVACHEATAAYYDRRAEEYDHWHLGRGPFADGDRPGWDQEVERLVAFVQDLPTGRTLDVACGSGYLTQRLRGVVVGLDQSRAIPAGAIG